MPIPKKFISQFEEEQFYHIICKSIDQKILFKSDNNRDYFFNGYKEFLGDFVDTYAYCLLDNHVHWLIKTKPIAFLLNFLNTNFTEKLTITHKKFIENNCSFHELIEQQFNRFFIAYSLSFNKSNNIKGHLFNRPFKRIQVKDDAHFTQLLIYIHANPLKHTIMKNFKNYKWSSYNSIIENKFTNLKREEVLDWFGGRDKFIVAHEKMAEYYYEHSMSGE